MTSAERKLWARLRAMKTRGFHSRRQTPIGRYIVDFCCHDARLLIEVDSASHSNDADRIYDRRRSDWLNSQGYRVLRFWNNEGSGNIDGVAQAISAEMHPHPFPSPQGGGGKPITGLRMS